MDFTLQAQLLTLRSSVDAALGAAQQSRQLPSQEARWAPGERMTARVEAALPGGRFHVRVDDLLMEMQLPDGFQTGDRIELEFVTANPRPSFVLRSGPEVGVRQEVQFSASSRNLDQIVKSLAPERAAGTQAGTTPIKEPAPLLAAPSTDAAHLAQALSGALGRSGLFYESHQAQWVFGQKPMEELLREPQGRLSSTAAASPGSTPAHSADNADPAAPPVHPDTLPQVRSQLDALDQRQLVWQGQLWPGQNLEWRIDEPGQEPNANGEAQPWFTQLRLHLPQLGDVSADLALVGSALRVRLSAPDATAQGAMANGRDTLAGALSAAGLDLISFNVGDGGA